MKTSQPNNLENYNDKGQSSEFNLLSFDSHMAFSNNQKSMKTGRR